MGESRVLRGRPPTAGMMMSRPRGSGVRAREGWNVQADGEEFGFIPHFPYHNPLSREV